MASAYFLGVTLFEEFQEYENESCVQLKLDVRRVRSAKMMSVGSFLHRGYRLYLKIPPFRGTRKIPRLLKVTLYCNLSNFWRELKSIALGLEIFMKKRKRL